MCRRVRCEVCEKPSYAGCGRHIEQVLGAVPEEDRCHCRSAGTQQKLRSAVGMVTLQQPQG